MAFFLAMAEDPSWVPAGLSTTADVVEHMLKLGGALGFAYVLATGLAYRAGSRRGKSIGEYQRLLAGKPNLKPFPEDSSETPFWKDNALLQGGINGILVMAVLFSYVVIMLAIFPPSAATLPKAIVPLMVYPNAMAAFFACFWTFAMRRLKIVPMYFLAALSLLGGVLTLVFLLKQGANPNAALTKQILLAIVQTVILSYFVALGKGGELADLESRYPLVTVTTSDGHTRNGLRIIKVSPSDCRFMEADGSVSLIPKSKIASVRTL